MFELSVFNSKYQSLYIHKLPIVFVYLAIHTFDNNNYITDSNEGKNTVPSFMYHSSKN
jgi:hypothetical protein